MAAPPHFGTPITRFVAPSGAPPKAPVAQSAWRRRFILTHSSSHVSRSHWEPHPRLHPFTRCVAKR
eukprot:5177448-Pyramimonas_sp.AAC.1